ncbi:MAG: UTP--glucose-1-phosphate uridylyltransferase, partial [Nanobdellota archaeon]
RFLPVKKTNDLLAIRSDRYLLDKDYRVIRNPECETESIFIDLDKNYYKLVEQMESRFEEIPSMLSCSRFEVEGDVKFGSKISLKGEVRVKNEGEQKKLENTTLEGVKEL